MNFISVIEAPQWLKDRMEAITKLPSPTLKEVQIQYNSSQQERKKHVRENL